MQHTPLALLMHTRPLSRSCSDLAYTSAVRCVACRLMERATQKSFLALCWFRFTACFQREVSDQECIEEADSSSYCYM